MVHWDRVKYRRRLLVQILSLLSTVAVFSFFYYEQDGYAERGEAFSIVNKFVIPMKEISGIHQLPGSNELAVVSDRRAEISYIGADGSLHESRSFKQLLIDRFSLCRGDESDECKKMIKKLTSNWEALGIDGSGRIFVLQEHTQSVLVLDRELGRIERVLHFNFMAAFPDSMLRGSNKIRGNAMGEGLLLLKNGHFLVAKEQFPMAFVEFGPAGEAPLGVSAATLLGADEEFVLPVQDNIHTDYEPLSSWLLSGHSKCDISDIDHDANGQLLVLSQSCSQVSVLKSLVPGAPVELVERLELPAEIKNPEALTRIGERWIVGSDIPSKHDHNFYILKRQTSL